MQDEPRRRSSAGTFFELRTARPNRHAGTRWACHVRLPHAPRSHQRPAWPLPRARHEAPRRRACQPADSEPCRDTRRRCRDAPRRGCDVPPPGRDAPRHGRGQGLRGQLARDRVGIRHRVNRLSTATTMHWRFLDRTAGIDSTAIDWRFSVGQRFKIRLINEMDSDHPMHHPFHLHGAGRFLVLARDGTVEPNLVWKDTVLIRTGQTWTSCSTSATLAWGWRTATSPNTCKAG
jgi:FtsP/CotA-like multicopper oxidase with cupredoxin domain